MAINKNDTEWSEVILKSSLHAGGRVQPDSSCSVLVQPPGPENKKTGRGTVTPQEPWEFLVARGAQQNWLSRYLNGLEAHWRSDKESPLKGDAIIKGY